MSIKFNCPNCQKTLKVSAQLSGKKARCPGCQQVLRIPTVDVPSPDVEAQAAAALADEPPAAAPEQAEEPTTIEFTCPQCDETIKVSAELAGKQTPCPECSKIIKVPVPIKAKKKDWRNVDTRKPAAGLLREDQPEAPEGAWGSAVSRGSVSKSSLIEADAIPILRQRTPIGQWIGRGVKVLALVAIVGFGARMFFHQRTDRVQTKALDQALKVMESNKAQLGNLGQGEVFRGAGEFYLVKNDPEKARRAFGDARARLASAPSSPERDARLIDLAENQVELGGTTEQLHDHVRLKWEVLTNELRQTMTKIGPSNEARAMAIRVVSRKLIEKGQNKLAETPAAQLSEAKDRPELLALAGLELFRADDRQTAETVAKTAAKPYEEKAAPNKTGPALLVAPSLIALLVALDQTPRAEKLLIAAPDQGKEPYPEARLGYAQGWAYQGKWDQAQQLAVAKGSATDRLEAMVAVAAIAADKNPEVAKKMAEAAIVLLEGELKNRALSSWLILRLATTAARVGLGERVQSILPTMSDADLRSRAQIEVMRARLAASGKPDMEAMDAAAKQQPPPPRLLEFLARHNTRSASSSSVLDAVASWQPESMRAFGYIGAALGEQDDAK